jgi:uncharacterized membrane protein YciS (DUF1049 family)
MGYAKGGSMRFCKNDFRPQRVPAMSKFSIKTLLVIVAGCGLIVTLIMARLELGKTTLRLAEVDKKIENYERELGVINVADPKKSYIRDYWSAVRYCDGKFNVRLADGSKAHVYYYGGKLPRQGVPENGVELTMNRRSPIGPVEFTIYIDHDMMGPGNVSKLFFSLHSYDRRFSGGRFEYSPSWNPWSNPSVNDVSCYIDGARGEEVIEFDLDEEPLVVLKVFDSEPDGSQTGYMVWIENEKDEIEEAYAK